LLDVGGKGISIGTNKFNATSLNSPLATVTKGVGIYIGSTSSQALSQVRNLTIRGNQFTDVIPLVLDLSTASTGTSPAATAQFTFGSNQVYNPVTSSFTTFGRFIVGGTSADILTGALSPTRDDFISGAQGNDTLTGNGGSDAFVFAFQPGTANNNVDRITDFKDNGDADKIWLDDAVFPTLSKGSLGSSFGTFINYDSGTKGLFYDPLGGGSTTETGSTLKIATLGGLSVAPVAGDFVVF
jgi:Ca2+-binding RTX toxin-like protein